MRTNRRHRLGSVVPALALGALFVAAPDPASGGRQNPAAVEANPHARPAPGQPLYVPLRPIDGDYEVISGDPEKVGEPFVIRIHELPGTIIPPHSHPVDEHITVVRGTIYFAVSETYDPRLLRELPTGSYAFAPKGRTMFGAAPEAAIVQVHGIGPFHIYWRHGVATLDDADAASHFRFGKGQRVATPRGDGVIRQGYRSGDVIQYAVLGETGELFMANEAETALARAR